MSGVGAVHQAPARMLAGRAVARSTGILTASSGKLKRLFCMIDGELVFAASNVIEEQLDEFLVQRKLISEGERVVVKQEAEQQKTKFSALVSSKQLLQPAVLHQAMRQYVQTLLFATLDTREIEYEFSVGRPDLGDEILVQMACAPLVLEFVAKHPKSVDDVRIRIGPPDLVPRIQPDPLALLEGQARGSAVEYLLEACDGSTSLTDLLTRTQISSENVLRAAYGLTLLGILGTVVVEKPLSGLAAEKASREETVARIHQARDADHYGVLGIDAQATRDQVRDGYYMLARRFHPDRFRSGDLVDLLHQVEAFFTKVTEAYNTLFDPDLRKQYDEELVATAGKTEDKSDQDVGYLARENYARAMALIGRNRLQDAVQFLENAIKLDTSRSEYYLELGKLLARNPRRRKESEPHLLRAAELDPAAVDAYLALGGLYAKLGRNDEAAEKYREALRWEPGNSEAKAALGEGGESGLFGGLFKG